MYTVSRQILLGLLLVIGLALQLMAMLPQMPSRIATSFGLSGAPEGYMTHQQFLWFEAGMVAMTWLVFMNPGWLRWFPNSINVPNRQYWLAPERRSFTLKSIREQMQWFGCMMLVFVALMTQSIFQANLSTPVHLGSSFFVGLGGWVAFVLWWTIKFTRRFRYR